VKFHLSQYQFKTLWHSPRGVIIMKKKFINLCNKITLRNAYRAVEVIWDRLRGVDFSGTLEFVDLGYEPDPDHRSEPT
jgi:hypothetical protein